MQNFDGSIVKIDSGVKSTIEGAIATMANNALRTIIIAKKDVKGENLENKDTKGVFDIE